MNRGNARWIGRLALALAAAAAVYAVSVAVPEVGEPNASPHLAGAKLWSFGFVGDTQLGEGIVEPIFARLRAADVQFVLHLGDMVEHADRDDEWNDLLERAKRHDLRLMPVVGNHDRMPCYDDRGEIRFRRYFPELPETFYHFEQGGLNFLMLNSERSFAPWSEQGRFLKWQLEQHPGTALVCLHRPVFTCGRRDLANQWLRRVWLHGRLKGSGATLVLAGHHHYYDRSKPLDGITYVVSGGGSRKLYGEEPPDERTAKFRAGVNHFGVVDVFADRLLVRVLDLEGREIDRFAIAINDPLPDY
ncbi:MAG TPA: metallophosphoesterase [Pirellulales bacterium]|nr:metallophosphoesterase [Pirellulales bacterium]